MRAVLAGLAVCLMGASAPPSPITVIEHVNVVPMTRDGGVLADRTVLIENGRIRAIGSAAEVAVLRGAKRIDGRGKWLMPGLTDAHVHTLGPEFLKIQMGGDRPEFHRLNVQDMMTPYIANGVTQVFDLGAMPSTLEYRDRIERGEILGPHYATAHLIDGAAAVRPGVTGAATPEEGRQRVRAAKAAGYDAVKTYSRLDRATFLAIVDEAKVQGLRVVGHIPDAYRGETDQALVPGFALVAHVEEFAKQSKDFSDADVARFTEMARRNGTWMVATANTSLQIARQTRDFRVIGDVPTARYLDPITHRIWFDENSYAKRATPQRADRFDKIAEFDRRMVKAFGAAGIPVLAGTDTPLPGLFQGYSLHDELDELARSGLSNLQVLAGATRQPAEWLGLDKDRGTVEAGKRADLILLDADPLADVANTRKISAVVLGGKVLPRKRLDAMMEDMARRNARARADAAKAAEKAAATFEVGEAAYQRHITALAKDLPPKMAQGMTAQCSAPPAPAASAASADVSAVPQDPSKSAIAPAQVFDQLYFLGDKDVSVWALDTRDGLVLFDATHAALVEDRVIGGLTRLGLDPRRIKYVVVTHAHDDHYGGARLLQQRYGAQVIMGAADWKVKPDPASKGAKEPMPRKDIAVSAPYRLTLGGTTVTLIPTPGHTPGTLSALIPVTDEGLPHVAALVGGGFPFGSVEGMKTFAASMGRYRGAAAAQGADAMISNHPKNDESLSKLPKLAARKPGEPNPFVGGRDAVQGRMALADHCARAWIARNAS